MSALPRTVLPVSSAASFDFVGFRARERARAVYLARAALAAAPDHGNDSTFVITPIVVFVILPMVAFVFYSSRHATLASLALLVAVLLLHEGGHLLGMRMFGFTDRRTVFLPFVGAAAGGHRRAANSTELAIVTLMGPVPGLMVALSLTFVPGIAPLPDGSLPLLASVVVMLALVNGGNLLPIRSFDGGRLYETLLLSRVPGLEILGRVLAIGWFGFGALGGGWLGWLCGIFAFETAICFKANARLAFAAARLRKSFRYSPDLSTVGDEELAGLAGAADRLVAKLRVGEVTRKKLWQKTVRELYDRVALPLAPWWVTSLLLLVWVGGLWLGLAAAARLG